MTLDGIFTQITNEMTRRLRLAHEGQNPRMSSHPLSTNLGAISALTEEAAEASEAALSLLGTVLGMQIKQGDVIRTVNDIEQLLWRFRDDAQMESIDKEMVVLLRSKLQDELVELGSIVVSWLLRLQDEETRRLEKIQDDSHYRLPPQ